MSSRELTAMNGDDRDDYLARREQERRIQEGSLDPLASRRPFTSEATQRDRRQVAAWMKGGLRDYLGETNRRRPSSYGARRPTIG